METKIDRYQWDMIVYILLMLSADLSTYVEDQVLCFAEVIEGTLDAVFEPEFLKTLNPSFGLTAHSIEAFGNLRIEVQALYAPGWSHQLGNPDELVSIRTRANELLKELGIQYVEPISYSDEHLEGVDWT